MTEEEIQRRSSPVLSGQWVASTAEYAAFKLMLTGGDDRALVSTNDSPARRERDGGKIELLDQMIGELQAELDEEGVDEGELTDQKEKLEASLEARTQALNAVQREFSSLMGARAETAKDLKRTKARLLEISELIDRFTLLDRHYESDLNRLQAIHESGTLFVHLEAKPCPLCGAHPGDQHRESDCDGNTEAVVIAANAEIEKILRLRSELDDTLETLAAESSQLSGNMPALQSAYNKIDTELGEVASPAVSRERTSYNELMTKLGTVKASLEKIARLENLVQRRAYLDEEGGSEDGSPQVTKTLISKSVLDEFAQEIQQILEDWDYPDASRVFFDESKKDIQISGKERGSTGKGLRAITHAAFTIGLMQFCRDRSLPHPGFVVLDSPLLAYWKPEGDADDLRGSGLKDKFYRYLLGMSKDSQVIVIENEHPPDFVEKEAPVTVFTRNPGVGRYGFFPLS